MVLKPNQLNPNYLAMVRGTRELHQLIAAGLDDSPEADAIRDATDVPWDSISELERNRVRNLSEDLYSLVEDPQPTRPMNPQSQGKLIEALEAKQRGEWDRALDLLRRWRANIDPAHLSYLRGSIWLEAGDPETATLFFEHASNRQPDNEAYLTIFLHALNMADPASAVGRADEILREHNTHSPVVVTKAADIKFLSTRRSSDTEFRRVFEYLEPILQGTLAQFEQRDISGVRRSSYVLLHLLLGLGFEHVGNRQAAVEFYSRGLVIEPKNDALLVARGMLQYGTSSNAIIDFETAIQVGSTLIWPHFFLAHHSILNGQFGECLKRCERAINLGGSATVLSEVLEWQAIAEAELGFPPELVRASFEQAIRLDPSNERAKRNLEVFEAASRMTAKNWEKRSPGAIRAAGLGEWRFAAA